MSRIKTRRRRATATDARLAWTGDAMDMAENYHRQMHLTT